MRYWRIALVAIALALLAVVPARADTVLYNTLGPGSSYDGTSGQSIFLFDIGLGILNRGVSVSFTPTVDTVLDQVLLPVIAPVGGSILVSVAEDGNFSFFPGGTDGAGAVLESFTVAGTSAPELVDLTSVLNPVLSAGQKYWIELQPGAGLNYPGGYWFNNNQGLTGEISTYDTIEKLPVAPYTRPGTAPAVEVLGLTPTTSVAEPATLSLMGVGAFLFGFLKRKRLLLG